MSEGYVGYYNEPEGCQEGEYVLMADGRWYHKNIVKEMTMARAAEEMACEEKHLAAALGNKPCEDCGDDSWVGEDELVQENPKYVQAQKEGKPRMEMLVGSVLRGDAAVHAHGADKYGERNWRKDPIKASTYEAAILRHFMAYFYDREDVDPDSGLSHLYHIRACCAVMIDAEIHETLIDDRDRVCGHVKR